MTIQTDLQSLAPGAIVDMYEIDTGAYGLGIIRFSPFTNELGEDIQWQYEVSGAPKVYVRFPIEVDGYKKSSRGTLPRPTMTVANLGTGLLSPLLKLYNSFLGAKVTRKRTLVKYLNKENFASGINDFADPNSHFPDEIYYIDRKASENPVSITLELAVAWDVTGVKLPLRQVIRDTCVWKYRGADGNCGYVGDLYFDADDQPVASLSQDVCSQHMSGCKLRFGDNAELPASFFPSVGLIR